MIYSAAIRGVRRPISCSAIHNFKKSTKACTLRGITGACG